MGNFMSSSSSPLSLNVARYASRTTGGKMPARLVKCYLSFSMPLIRQKLLPVEPMITSL